LIAIVAICMLITDHGVGIRHQRQVARSPIG
jgi:hypothetical protein